MHMGESPRQPLSKLYMHMVRTAINHDVPCRKGWVRVIVLDFKGMETKY